MPLCDDEFLDASGEGNVEYARDGPIQDDLWGGGMGEWGRDVDDGIDSAHSSLQVRRDQVVCRRTTRSSC